MPEYFLLCAVNHSVHILPVFTVEPSRILFDFYFENLFCNLSISLVLLSIVIELSSYYSP